MNRIEVVAAVIKRQGRYFATQRGYGEYKDWWEFPGGKIEPGEMREDALVREIKEELGATVAVDKFLCTIESDYADFHLTLHNYLCHVVEGHLELHEAEAARWLEKDKLRSVNWLPADAEVVECLLKINE